MAYLTCIGPQGGNRYNKSKFGSRGYWVFRRGTTAVTRWGAVKTIRSQTYEVRWIYCKGKNIPCRTIRRAQKKLEVIIASLKRPHLGYSLWPRGVRIKGRPPISDAG